LIHVRCIFCQIVAGHSPASIIHQDEHVMAFMGIRPTSPGECLVIPKAHIDHFTDLDDGTAQRIMVVAQRIGRRIMTVFKPLRVGMLVHGFGVPHAHLILVPQLGPHHLTSDRFATVDDGEIIFSERNIPLADRSTLDEHARLLAQA
jgi:histidine triad (HIT) family protein